MTHLDFSDLEDFDNAPVRKTSAPVDEKPCFKCGGSGRVHYGYVNLTSYECKLCKGTGKTTDQRVKRFNAAKKAMRTAEVNKASRYENFSKAHKAEYNWLVQNQDRNDFARSLMEQIGSPRGLSEKQLACIRRNLDKQAERKQERANAAPDLGGEARKMIDVFHMAASNGHKRPKVRTESFNFKLAGGNSANSGWVYVTDATTEEYIGKINPDGKFFGYKTPEATLNSLIEVCKNPLEASIKYGQKTGICSCCGRTLTDKTSIAMGIGPICAENFFGA